MPEGISISCRLQLPGCDLAGLSSCEPDSPSAHFLQVDTPQKGLVDKPEGGVKCYLIQADLLPGKHTRALDPGSHCP